MNCTILGVPDFSGRLCLTLLHSLWQVALLVLVAWTLDRPWMRRSVQKSYALHVAALVMGLAAAPITFVLVGSSTPATVAGTENALDTRLHAIAPGAATLPDAAPATDESEQAPIAGRSPSVPDTVVLTPVTSEMEESSAAWLRIASWLAALYALGVLGMLARLAGGIWQAGRLGRAAELVADGPLVDGLNTLARKWSMRIVPALAQAERIIVPQVVGFVRPMILLPTSAITGLSTEELEMILAHELAHVRRWDMWVAGLQRLAEAVLFFNPALWCLSRRISTLREYCCDELACGAMSESGGEGRTRYASALLRVVELKQSHARRALAGSDLATLAAGGRSPSEVRRRVARLLGEPLREPLRFSRGGMFTLALLAALLVMGPTAWQSAADGPDPPVEDTTEDTADDVAPEETPEPTAPITIFGRAVDEQGKPIAGAEIFLAACKPDHKRIAQTTSAADGSYRFEEVTLPIQAPDAHMRERRGSFEVFGVAQEYALTWQPKKSFYPDQKHATGSDPNTSSPDWPTGYGTEDPVELDLTFLPPKTIRGTIVDESGRPIPGTTLAIRSGSWLRDGEENQPRLSYSAISSLNNPDIVPPEVKLRTTGEDGRFEFTGLPANYRWRIDVRPPGFARRSISVATREGAVLDQNVYTGDCEVVFHTPRKVKLRVVCDDTGEPAAKVGIGGRVNVAGFWETTDDDGLVEVLLPDGRYHLSISPRYGTPYWWTEFEEFVVSDETVQQTNTLRLRAAGVVDVTVLDADTREPLSGVKLWLEKQTRDGTTYRADPGYYSWEVETRISHYENPRSDANGKMRVLFEPGKYRVGIGYEVSLRGYWPVEPGGIEVDLQVGKPVSVEFQMRRPTEEAEDVVKELNAKWERQRSEIKTAYIRYGRISNGGDGVEPRTPEEVGEILNRVDLGARPDDLRLIIAELVKPLDPEMRRKSPGTDPWSVLEFHGEGLKTRVDRPSIHDYTDADVFDGENLLSTRFVNNQISLHLPGQTSLHYTTLAEFRLVPNTRWGAKSFLGRGDGEVFFQLRGGNIGPEMIVDEATGLVLRRTVLLDGGAVYRDYWQFGSVDYGSGIVFPSLIIRTTYKSGILDNVGVFLILEARFNEELPADVFAVAVPSGTNIFDYRLGGERPRFGKAPEDLEDVVAYVDERVARRSEGE